MSSLPKDATPINAINRLHVLPRGTAKGDWARPWYLYDMVDPAAKFRKVPDDYDHEDPYISEGEVSEDLSDSAGDDKVPVQVYGYMCVPISTTEYKSSH